MLTDLMSTLRPVLADQCLWLRSVEITLHTYFSRYVVYMHVHVYVHVYRELGFLMFLI